MTSPQFSEDLSLYISFGGDGKDENYRFLSTLASGLLVAREFASAYEAAFTKPQEDDTSGDHSYWLVRRALLIALITQVGNILDDAKSGKYYNMSLWGASERCSDEYKAKWIAIDSQHKDLIDKIKNVRNKFIIHSDVDTNHEPSVDIDEVVRLLNDACEWLCEMVKDCYNISLSVMDPDPSAIGALIGWAEAQQNGE